MRKICLVIAVLFITSNLFAQNRSINFVDCSFDEALKLSAESKKPLFIDCYTSWCGPCKMMTKDVFTNDEVADYFNANFICIKFDCEKGEGPTIASKYQVSGYPTFLIIENKEVIHKMMGGTSPEKFIANTKKGLDPEFSMYGRRKKYESGNYDSKFLLSYFNELVNLRERSAKEVGEKILATTPEADLFTKEMWNVVKYYQLSNYNSKWWNFILDNSNKYIEIVGKEAFNRKLSETMHPYLFGFFTGKRTEANSKKDFNSYKKLIEKYQLENKELLFSFWRLGYSRTFDNFNGFFKTVEKEYATSLDLGEHYRVMVNTIDHLLANSTPAQKEKLLNLIKKSAEKQNDYMKEVYKQLFEKF